MSYYEKQTLILYYFFVFLTFYSASFALYFWAAFFSGNVTENLRQINYDSFILLIKSILIAFVVAFSSTFFGTVWLLFCTKPNVPLRNFFKTALLNRFLFLHIFWRLLGAIFFTFSPEYKLYQLLTPGVILVLTSIFTPLSMLIKRQRFKQYLMLHRKKAGLTYDFPASK